MTPEAHMPGTQSRAAGGLRARLRDALAPDHERVDAAYGALDLARAGDLALFVAAHRLALHGLDARTEDRPGDEPRHMPPGALGDLVRRLDRDASALGLDPLAAVTPSGPPIPALAADYVVLGSRLGARVLRRRWEAGAVARGAGRYLCAPPPTGAWRALCLDLSARPAEGAEAERVVRGARAAFALFEGALTLVAAPVGERAHA